MHGGQLAFTEIQLLNSLHRLTPAYAFCILISNTLWLKMGGGPLFVYIGKYLSRSCDRYWWTNLLYINNMYPSGMGDEVFLFV